MHYSTWFTISSQHSVFELSISNATRLEHICTNFILWIGRWWTDGQNLFHHVRLIYDDICNTLSVNFAWVCVNSLQVFIWLLVIKHVFDHHAWNVAHRNWGVSPRFAEMKIEALTIFWRLSIFGFEVWSIYFRNFKIFWFWILNHLS